jgi:F-type H+-transporting ATPase subunit b
MAVAPLSLILAAQEGAATAAHAGGEAKGAFPPFEPALFASQLVWFALSFIALYLILSRYLLPKIGSVLHARATTISNDLDQAAQKSADADAAKTAMEKSVAKARADARAMVDRARAETQAKLNAEQEAADARLTAKIQAEEAKVEAARTKALAEVPAEADKLARDIADKLAPANANATAARSTVGVA